MNHTKRIKRLIVASMTAIMIALGTPSAKAQYEVYSVKGGVKMERAGRATPLKVGVQVGLKDFIVIPEGGHVEIINKTNNKIYESVKTGRFNVSTIMLDSDANARNKGKTLNEKLSMGKNDNSGKRKKRDVYIDRGVVTREKTFSDSLFEDTITVVVDTIAVE